MTLLSMSNLKAKCFWSEVEIILAKNNNVFDLQIMNSNYKGGVVMASLVQPPSWGCLLQHWGIPGGTSGLHMCYYDKHPFNHTHLIKYKVLTFTLHMQHFLLSKMPVCHMQR